MINKILKNSKLKFISASILPKQIGRKSVDVIMLFNDGFISRGYYNYEDLSWYGYNTFMDAEKYFNNPDYYIEL